MKCVNLVHCSFIVATSFYASLPICKKVPRTGNGYDIALADFLTLHFAILI